jgi:hypothetical protein
VQDRFKPTPGSKPPPSAGRAYIGDNVINEQVISADPEVFFSISHSGSYHLGNRVGSPLTHKAQHRERFLDIHPSDSVHNEADFLGRDGDMASRGVNIVSHNYSFLVFLSAKWPR